jgi:inward rectifier potassium channel
MNGESIDAPAPWASTSVRGALGEPSIMNPSSSTPTIRKTAFHVFGLDSALYFSTMASLFERQFIQRIQHRLLPRSRDWAVPGDGYFGDFYHQLMTSSWPRLLLEVTAAFIVVNCLFALGYLVAGGIDNARRGSFSDAFFFSVQTMATIGYGKMAPASLIANLLASAQALTGLLAFAVVTGLVFSKFSRPTARVRFTRNAVISLRDGVPSLMFRMANVRANQIVEAQAHVVFARQETTLEGEEVRRFYDLELTRYRNTIFSNSWTAVHPINLNSPLYGATAETLNASDADIVVSLTGIDETFSQTIYARYYYGAEDIIWGARLADIITRTPEGESQFDFARYDQVVPAALPQSERIGSEIHE